MKINRIIENFLEFLLLCATTFFLIWALSKNVASHDYIVLSILLITYGITISVNFILQTIRLLNSSKTGRRYFFAKTKLFAILLVVSAILGTLFFIRDGIEVFFFFFFFSVAVFIPYIIIIFLLFHFDKFLQSELYRTWISQKKNRILQYSIIGVILLVVVVSITVTILNKQEKNYWKNCYNSNTIESYNTYIQRYPRGKHVEEAMWEMSKKNDNIASYDDYIKKYSNGQYVEETLFRKALLLKSKEAVDLYLEAYPLGKFKKPLELMLKSESGKFVDKRDGKEYGWVKIGEQIWMAENLNYETLDSRCYEDNLQNCEKYGRLYLWDEAQCACPEGWRLPNNSDWEMLEEYVEWEVPCTDCQTWNGFGLVELATIDGKYLLLQSKNEWGHSNGNNATGFSAIPTKGFYDVPEYASWWSSSKREQKDEQDYYFLHYWSMGSEDFFGQRDSKRAQHSIRCIKKID